MSDDTPDRETRREQAEEVKRLRRRRDADDWAESKPDRISGRLKRGVLRGFGGAIDAGDRFVTGIVEIVHGIIGTFLGVIAGLLIGLLRFVPRGEAFWKGLVSMGMRGMYKSSGGDAVGLIARSNGLLEPVPVKWKPNDPDDPTTPAQWRTKSGETWGPGAEGRGFERMGDTPVALFDEDAQDRGSFLQSRFAEALDLGQKQAVYIPEKVEQIQVEITPDEGKSPTEALADGGFQEARTSYRIADDEWSDKLADVLVDLRSDVGSAMRVSAGKYKEVYQEKVGSEEMQAQELRGRAAEADPQAAKDLMFRVLKWVALIILATHAPEILTMLLGGEGNASSIGSDINPFMILPDLMMQLPGVLF